MQLHTVKQKRCPLQGKIVRNCCNFECSFGFFFFSVYLSYLRKKEVLIGSGFVEKLEIFSGPLPITIPSDLINLFAVLLQILSRSANLNCSQFLKLSIFKSFALKSGLFLMNLYPYIGIKTTIILPSFSERSLEKHLYTKNGRPRDPLMLFPAIGKLSVSLRIVEY